MSKPLSPISYSPADDSPTNYIDISDFLRDKMRTQGGSYWQVDFRTTDSFDAIHARLVEKGWDLRSKIVRTGRNSEGNLIPQSTSALYSLGEVEDDALLQVFLSNEKSGDFYAWSPDANVDVRGLIEGVVLDLPVPAAKVVEETLVHFSYMSGTGPKFKQRFIKTPHFSEIMDNYPKQLQPQLQELADMRLNKEEDLSGHVIILHGPAGTGKTTLLRGLSREWRDWAHIMYVVDPDVLFRDSAYLYSLLEVESGSRWGFVMLLEDVDEFIGPRAKVESGQAFSRLLNLTDGFLGQGINLLLVMTTNIKLDDIQEALKRKGRCMANIHVPEFNAKEASNWLGTHVEKPMTLADMYESQADAKQLEALVARPSTGAYL